MIFTPRDVRTMQIEELVTLNSMNKLKIHGMMKKITGPIILSGTQKGVYH